jgi:DNA polymerase III psi subunit
MSDQLTNNPEALRLFFTEEIYLVDAPQHSAGSVSERVHDKVAGGISEDVHGYVPGDVHQSVPVVNEANGTVPDLSNEEQDTLPAIPDASAPATQPFSYVGANERNILILVNDDRYPVSTQEGRELLGNILKAIGLNRNDCALVNYTTCSGANFQQLNDFFKPQYVFAFGVTPEQLDIPGAQYNSIVQQGASKLIFSSNLDALSGDATTKKLLWGSLKQIKL